jgi:hypothetical protein
MIRSMSDQLPLKNVDLYFNAGVDNAGVLGFMLPGIIQGTANGQRTGDEIEYDYIDVRALFTWGDAIGNAIRFMIIQTEGPGNAYGISDVLSNTGATPTVVSHYQPFYKNAFFHVIHDEVITLSGSSKNALVSRVFKCIPKIKRIPYVPGSVNQKTGVIWYLLLSDSAIVPHPNAQISFRTYYRDI